MAVSEAAVSTIEEMPSTTTFLIKGVLRIQDNVAERKLT
jgi:hypothetical protein